MEAPCYTAPPQSLLTSVSQAKRLRLWSHAFRQISGWCNRTTDVWRPLVQGRIRQHDSNLSCYRHHHSSTENFSSQAKTDDCIVISKISPVILEILETSNFLGFPNRQHGLQHGLLHFTDLSSFIWIQGVESRYCSKIVNAGDAERTKHRLNLLVRTFERREAILQRPFNDCLDGDNLICSWILYANTAFVGFREHPIRRNGPFDVVLDCVWILRRRLVSNTGRYCQGNREGR